MKYIGKNPQITIYTEDSIFKITPSDINRMQNILCCDYVNQKSIEKYLKSLPKKATKKQVQKLLKDINLLK